jgi:hypothetical protein
VLSRAISDECKEAIRLDADNDIAMHVLGRYEHQMAGLGGGLCTTRIHLTTHSL